MKNSSCLDISCRIVFSLNKWNKKGGSPSSFLRNCWGKRRRSTSKNSFPRENWGEFQDGCRLRGWKEASILQGMSVYIEIQP